MQKERAVKTLFQCKTLLVSLSLTASWTRTLVLHCPPALLFVPWINTARLCVVWNADTVDNAHFLLFVLLSLRAQETFLQWDHFRRFYNFLMADNMKKIILSHRYLSGPADGSCFCLIAEAPY